MNNEPYPWEYDPMRDSALDPSASAEVLYPWERRPEDKPERGGDFLGLAEMLDERGAQIPEHIARLRDQP